jgi:hypothetical protein
MRAGKTVVWTGITGRIDRNIQVNSNYVPIPTLGFIYRLGDLSENATGWERFIRAAIYAEVTYVPPLRFPDGIETETRNYYDETQRQFVNQIVQHPQTGRKAGVWGFDLGVNLVPYSMIPVGLDFKFGLWFSRIEYVSGTCLSYDGRADISFLTDTTWGRAMGP